MSDIILTTFDWVPEMPRGYVRDLRVRWALEEAALAYRVESTPFLGELSDKLMPAGRRGRSDAKEWLFAALASVEAASQPWSFFMFSGDTDETPMRKFFDSFLEARLKHMETVLDGSEWLVGTFSVADILMADVLRLVDRFDGLPKFPACRAYVERATARPAFVKAYDDQMAHFAAADAA
jgi:glutathione S-transferase